MLARYREAVETVLRFRDNRDRQIRGAVINLLPRLAAFAPERFAATYLKQCTDYLLQVLKVPAERGAGGWGSRLNSRLACMQCPSARPVLSPAVSSAALRCHALQASPALQPSLRWATWRGRCPTSVSSR